MSSEAQIKADSYSQSDIGLLVITMISLVITITSTCSHTVLYCTFAVSVMSGCYPVLSSCPCVWIWLCLFLSCAGCDAATSFPTMPIHIYQEWAPCQLASSLLNSRIYVLIHFKTHIDSSGEGSDSLLYLCTADSPYCHLPNTISILSSTNVFDIPIQTDRRF